MDQKNTFNSQRKLNILENLFIPITPKLSTCFYFSISNNYHLFYIIQFICKYKASSKSAFFRISYKPILTITMRHSLFRTSFTH